MPARGGDERVPGDLTVVVGVDVDAAGRDVLARGVELALAAARDLADLDDAIAVDGDVALADLRAAAVHQGPTANHQIVHASLPPRRSGAPGTGADYHTGLQYRR